MAKKSNMDVMRGVYATRRANLKLIASDQKSYKQLASDCGFSASYMTALIGINPTRAINEKTARKIECRLSLQAGWLDMSRG